MDTYDIVTPLESRVLAVNAAAVGGIAEARVKTGKKDMKRLLNLLFGGIVPEVWVQTVHVRELRAFISRRNRLVRMATMICNHRQSLLLSEEGIPDGAWWDAQPSISMLERMQIRDVVTLLETERQRTQGPEL